MRKQLFFSFYKSKILYSILFIFFICYLAQKLYETDIYYSFRNMFLDNKTVCWNEQNFKSIEKQLLSLEVKEKIPIASRKNDVFLIVFSNGLKAVFKPERYLEDQISSLRTYYFSQYFNLRVVPPTVVRNIERGGGILQMFIEGQDLTKDIDLDSVPAKEKTKVYLFNFVIGYNDPAPRHNIVGKNCNHLAVIDGDSNMNYVTISRYKDFPFISDRSIIENQNLYYKFKAFFESEEKPFFDDRKIKTLQFMKTIDFSLFERAEVPIPHDLIRRLLNSSNNLAGNTLSYAEWRDLVWVKLIVKDYESVYVKFAPDKISKRNIKNFKKMDSLEKFNKDFLLFLESYYSQEDIKPLLEDIQVFNFFSFYNKSRLLEIFDK